MRKRQFPTYISLYCYVSGGCTPAELPGLGWLNVFLTLAVECLTGLLQYLNGTGSLCTRGARF